MLPGLYQTAKCAVLKLEKRRLNLYMDAKDYITYPMVDTSYWKLATAHSLVALSKKTLDDVPPCQQCFFLRLVQYGFTLHYIPRIKLVLATALLRAVQPCLQDKQCSLDVEVHAVGVLAAVLR